MYAHNNTNRIKLVGSGGNVLRTIYFWIGVLIFTGVLGLEDIAKFFGLEEQAKPLIDFINKHVNIKEWGQKISDIIKDFSLPEGVPDPNKK